MNSRSLVIENATVPPHQTSKDRSDETDLEIAVLTRCLVRAGDANVAWHQADERSGSLWSVEYGSFSEVESWEPLTDRLNREPHVAPIDLRDQTRKYVVVRDFRTETSRPESDSVFSDWTPRSQFVEFSNAKEFSWWDAVSDDVFSHNESRVRATRAGGYDRLATQVGRLFLAAQEERFETGMESAFSKRLQSIYAYSRDDLLRILKTRVYDGADPEVLSEMLAWISRQEQTSVTHETVNVLLLGLHHGSPLVRDAAALGLAYFVGRGSIRHLRSAIERESVPELSADLEELVSSLMS